MSVTKSIVQCSSCHKSWNLPKAHSVYEKQRQESCPCPHCGSNTLSHRETQARIRPTAESPRQPISLANAS